MTQRLSRTEASRAVEELGWRYLLGGLRTSVRVPTLGRAADVVTAAAEACAAAADEHLTVAATAGRVELTLQTASLADVTARDVHLAERVTAALREGGWTTAAGAPPRPVQSLEIAVDALDIPAVRPFWKAVLAYTDEPGRDGLTDPLVDPLVQGPAVWFQQMNEERPQRNRIHLDVTVPHDEADDGVSAALASGGRLVSDARARAFWVLADAEGNEVCVCTWQDRD